MKILQKIFSVITLSIFIFISVIQTSALDVNYEEYNYENVLIKEIIILKSDLKKIKSWDKFIKVINDLLIKKTNLEDLKKLQSKIYKIQNKLRNSKQTSKIKNYILIINYFDKKISLEIYKIEQAEKELILNEAEKKLEQMKNPTLSDSDNKLVNDKLVQIQLNLLENFKSNLDSIITDFKELTSYEQKWNFKLDFNMDHELTGEFNTKVELNNYTTVVSGFDSQFTWQIEALISAIPKWEEEIKLQLSSFVDFISKDWNLYILLEKFNITDKAWIENIKEQLVILKNIAEQNKYIVIEDQNTKIFLESLKTLNPNKILADSEAILSEPMFKAYKKDWNKYFLTPTKYACDKYKEILNKFDPWNWNTCSNSQYENMLEELANAWDLYIEIWTKNKIGFDAYPEYDIKSFNSYIVFTDKNIEEISSRLIAKEENEWYELNYIKWNKLDFYLNAWENINIDLKSSLTKNNKFDSIDFTYNAKWYREDLIWKLKLKNKKLTWNFEYNYSKYAWFNSETYQTKYSKQKVSILINWKQDYKNSLQNLDVNITGVDVENNEQFLNAQFQKNNKNYNTKLVLTDNNKTLFDFNLNLYNSKITGNTKVYNENWDEMIAITHTWKYETNFLELNNKIKLNQSIFDSYFWYLDSSRDINRISQLQAMADWLWLYSTNHSLPLPDNYTEVIENWTVIAYKWKIWKSVLETITYSTTWVDPETKEYFNYYLTKNKKYFILKSCLENKDNSLNWNDNFITSWKTYITNYSTWEKTKINYWDTTLDCSRFTIKEQEEKIIEANFNISADIRNNKNNSSIYVDYIENNKKIIKLEISNTATKEYKEIDITAPTNTININEAMWLQDIY